MKIATWNVNSVRARLPLIIQWVERERPDCLLLQEIKCEDKDFPAFEFEALGYRTLVKGQKSYNGVAIISRQEIKLVRDTLDSDETDDQARYLEAEIMGWRLINLYLPNGNPAPSEKYDYKLNWMKRLKARLQQLLSLESPVIAGGDFNVIPTPEDVYDPKLWKDDALFRLETRRAFREILNLGYSDAFRSFSPDIKDAYTFWDYQGSAWPKNLGLRIDHFLLSPEAQDKAIGCAIDPAPRAAEKASDHTPLILTLL